LIFILILSVRGRGAVAASSDPETMKKRNLHHIQKDGEERRRGLHAVLLGGRKSGALPLQQCAAGVVRSPGGRLAAEMGRGCWAARFCSLDIFAETADIVLSIYVRSEARAMKTTIDLPDVLYRRAKAEAALRGRKLEDLIEEGLRLVLKAPRKTLRRPTLATLMKRARGMVDSGVPDLASNPVHLAGLGRDARHR
jgi:hypothetical protein